MRKSRDVSRVKIRNREKFFPKYMRDIIYNEERWNAFLERYERKYQIRLVTKGVRFLEFKYAGEVWYKNICFRPSVSDHRMRFRAGVIRAMKMFEDRLRDGRHVEGKIVRTKRIILE